jgi:two-component system osmolarity sensor histidine kinase EnvZ
MQRDLSNLIRNAQLYGKPAILLSARREGRSVVVTVSDGGDGISSDEWDMLRRPFARADGSRGSKGTGLGLAIVERVAAAHGGHVEARQAGGRFGISLHLPLA